jgi:hypothetical protein
LPPTHFDALVVTEAAGEASQQEISLLEAHREHWVETLQRLVRETEIALEKVRRLDGPERAQVVADFEGERSGYLRTLSRLTGQPQKGRSEPAGGGDRPPQAEEEPVALALHLSWTPGRVVAWAGGPADEPATAAEVRELLAAAGAPSTGGGAHIPAPRPGGIKAPAQAAPINDVLGWLVAVGAEPGSHPVGTTVRWLGRVAALAVRLTAQGRMVPVFRQSRRRAAAAAADQAPYAVSWVPVLVDNDELAALTAAFPGALTAFQPDSTPRDVVRNVLTDLVDAICRSAAARVEVPAAPPRPRSVADVAETILTRLDGTPFAAPTRPSAELTGRLERWARPLATTDGIGLVVQLDPPDAEDVWRLAVLVAGVDRQAVPLHTALGTRNPEHRRAVAADLARLERLLPALRRPMDKRRGEVVLSGKEAWELMTDVGEALSAAGFDVRVPKLSRRRPLPSLRLTAEPSSPSVVGAHQLAAVRWTVAFDDVELDAADIARLAAEARPMVRSHGRWIELDRADLAEAAAALAERAHLNHLSGAAMLRHALGLEGPSLAGGITLRGNSWATDLLQRAESVSAQPLAAPAGFSGKLRSYQEEALAWMAFLDGAGLGGCLALDMGLGKTPTVLAHLQDTRGGGPTLVVAPPAVVGNWAAEAERFTPKLRVSIHHGAGRAATDELADLAADNDVVLTTYGTAVRDIEALAEINWDRLVLDEAQVIKNPTSETAQQLRRLPARTRVALTGTPIENGLGDLWAILDFTNPGLVGPRPQFVAQLSRDGNDRGSAEAALRALNGLLVFRRTKAEPAIAAELPDRVDQLDHCSVTSEQIGLYQAVLDNLVSSVGQAEGEEPRKGQILAAITALKQICNHPAAYSRDDLPLAGRSGKLARLEEIVDAVFDAGERVLVFTHFAEWGQRLAEHLTARFGMPIACYHGGLARGARDKLVADFQSGTGPGALVLSLKAGGTGLNLTAASHVVLYDRWWNPAVEDQARDRSWRIGQTRTVVCHRLVCPGTVDERVEEVVEGKRRIADLVLPRASSLGDLDVDQLRTAFGIRPDAVLTDDPDPSGSRQDTAA